MSDLRLAMMKPDGFELLTCWHLCAALGATTRASPELIIDSLVGILWDEEEAGSIKAFGMTPEERSERDGP